MSVPQERLLLRSVARLLAGAALALPLLAGVAEARSISGICPDGSVFIVQSARAIPCSDAKRVEPSEIPPQRPELLPRPYTWGVYQRGADPNNPYNMVDAARQVEQLRLGSAPRGGPAGFLADRDRAVPAPMPGGAPERDEVVPRDVGLTHGQLRDLYLIVELAQRRAPASFSQETADGREVMTVAFAHSDSFQAHFEELWRDGRAPQGAVVLFSVVAPAAARFFPNLTFTQGHLAFTPLLDDRRQFGMLQGRAGDLEEGEVLLGYVVLPPQMDLGAEMDVYWNDRHRSVTFRPY